MATERSAVVALSAGKFLFFFPEPRPQFCVTRPPKANWSESHVGNCSVCCWNLTPSRSQPCAKLKETVYFFTLWSSLWYCVQLISPDCTNVSEGMSASIFSVVPNCIVTVSHRTWRQQVSSETVATACENSYHNPKNKQFTLQPNLPRKFAIYNLLLSADCS